MEKVLVVLLYLLSISRISEEQSQSSTTLSTQTAQTVTCPEVMCGPESAIPEGCERVSFFEMNGVRCEGCEVNGCENDNLEPPCPKLLCEGPHVPKGCEMPTYFRNRHFVCQGCSRDICVTSSTATTSSSTASSNSAQRVLQTLTPTSTVTSMPWSWSLPWQLQSRWTNWTPRTTQRRFISIVRPVQPNLRRMWVLRRPLLNTGNHFRRSSSAATRFLRPTFHGRRIFHFPERRMLFSLV